MIDDVKFVLGRDYPERIVDHEFSARDAKRRISEVRKNIDFRVSTNVVFKKLGSRNRSTNQRKKQKKQDTDQLSLF